MKLNGWQRIWIVLSMLYLIVVIIVGIQNIPTSNKVYKEWSFSLIEWAIENDPKLVNQSAIKVRNDYPDTQDPELIRKIQEKYTNQNVFHQFDFEEINKKYQTRIENMRTLQAKYFCMGALIWIGPMVFIYILGWSVGWICRGFKKA